MKSVFLEESEYTMASVVTIVLLLLAIFITALLVKADTTTQWSELHVDTLPSREPSLPEQKMPAIVSSALPSCRRDLSGYRAGWLLVLALLLAGCIGFPSNSVTIQTYNAFVAVNGMMFGFDATHTHFNPYEHILTPANIARLAPAWTYPAVGVIASSPAVADGIVYVGSDDKSLYALDARSGKQLWSFATGGAIFSSPAVANGIVYIGSDDKSLYALDARPGSKLWSFATGGGIFSSPAVANGIVYVGSLDHSLYALDARSGKQLWSFATGDRIFSSPTVANGIVYIGSEDNALYTLDAHSGKQLWSFATGDRILSSPTVANGVVYIGSEDGKMYAFRLPS